MCFKPGVFIDDDPCLVSFPEALFADILQNAQQGFFGRKIIPVPQASHMDDQIFIQKMEVLLLADRALGNDDEHAFVTPLTLMAAESGSHRTAASSSHAVR